MVGLGGVGLPQKLAGIVQLLPEVLVGLRRNFSLLRHAASFGDLALAAMQVGLSLGDCESGRKDLVLGLLAENGVAALKLLLRVGVGSLRLRSLTLKGRPLARKLLRPAGNLGLADQKLVVTAARSGVPVLCLTNDGCAFVLKRATLRRLLVRPSGGHVTCRRGLGVELRPIGLDARAFVGQACGFLAHAIGLEVERPAIERDGAVRLLAGKRDFARSAIAMNL